MKLCEQLMTIFGRVVKNIDERDGMQLMMTNNYGLVVNQKMRDLTELELAFVSGGNDGDASCSSPGDCASDSSSSSSSSSDGGIPSLGEVTVTDSAAIGGIAGGTVGFVGVLTGTAGAVAVGDAIAIGTIFGGIIGVISAAIAAGIVTGINSIPSNPDVEPIGNPMGDTSGP